MQAELPTALAAHTALDLHLNSSETLHISHSFASGFGLGPASAGTRTLIKHLQNEIAGGDLVDLN